MKKHLISLITFILFSFLYTSAVFAQAPEKFTFQAEARDNQGTVIRNADIEVKITILEDSPTGTIVWEGTHEIITDKYGMFTLNIGEGTGGYIFSDIDWANNRYFLNVKVTNRKGDWVDQGTTQLLSVPYALHAKTAANMDVLPGDNVGIGVSDPQEALDVQGNVHVSGGFIAGSTTEYNDGSITLSSDEDLDIDEGTLFIDNDNNSVGIGTTSPSEKLEVDGSVKATAFIGDGSGLTGIVGGATIYSVGDFAQGGIIYWLDETGQHGLVCAKEDQGRVAWDWMDNGYHVHTRALGDGPFSGETNTTIIIAVRSALGFNDYVYAARICNELQITEGGKTYGDWYLPSKEELNLMYQTRAIIDATATANGGIAFSDGAYHEYWSSTEAGAADAWFQNFLDGTQEDSKTHGPSKNYGHAVRPIRAF